MNRTIDVGRTRSATKQEVFIAVPASNYDEALTPLLHDKKHIVVIDFKDLDWLIGALRKEHRMIVREKAENRRRL